jgi:hypothetical protein
MSAFDPKRTSDEEGGHGAAFNDRKLQVHCVRIAPDR